MLSYQHIYHAGNRADLHKHSILCTVLGVMRDHTRALTYCETHAGRGLYDLDAPEARKTRESDEGWLAADMARLPSALVNAALAVQATQGPRYYPGSPNFAAQLLRPQDRLHLCELHPQEYHALTKNMGYDGRITCHHADGYDTIFKLAPPFPRDGLVLIDPSYEVKSEYDSVADFIDRLCRRWKEAVILLWVPMLPAGRHISLLGKLASMVNCEDGLVHKFQWAQLKESGMFGSLMVLLNSQTVPRNFLPLANFKSVPE